MNLGLPVPDFDSGGYEQISVPYDMTTCMSTDVFDMCCRNGIQLISESPLRCTLNSSVYQGCTANDNCVVKISKNKIRLAREFQNRRALPDSSYLVRAIALYETDAHAMLQMELCEQGDVSSLEWSEPEIWQMIHDIGSALILLHSSGWMHLDISPGNILKSAGRYKLADFGTLVRVGEFREGDEGSGPYVSPEALAFPVSEFPVGTATDIFSFGLVLLECVTGKPAPRGGCDSYIKIRNGELGIGRCGYNSSCSRQLQDLVNSMLEKDPRKRPTAQDLISLSKH